MTDREPHWLLELEDERTTNRRRETFLLSVIFHLLLVLLVVTEPDLFRKFLQRDIPASEARPRDVTLLYQPSELPKVKVAPKTPVLSDANRKAQPGVETPPTPLQYRPPTPKPAPRTDSPKPGEEDRMARELPPIGLPNFPEPPKEPPKQRPTLEPVPRFEPTPSQAQLTLPPIVPPGRGTDSILRGMAKEHASGGGQSLGGGYQDYGPQDPNLNIPGPQILSDTMGVDFNPYLLRILSIVKRNWYAVIPEIARLGKQGRVVLEFSIVRNGNVPNLNLAAGSGTDSLDGAALSSIRLSSPFPPLPPEFPGQDIRLRFIYLYNMRVEY